MTGANRARNAAEELARAEACLAEARLLRDGDLPYGAASRAYYAVFHAARALLFSAGLEVRSHRGLFGLLGEHFVRTGKLPSDLARLAAHLQRDREDADYMVGSLFTDREAESMIAAAERFVIEARRLTGQ